MRQANATSTHLAWNAKAFALLIIGATAIAFAPVFVRLSEVGPTVTAFWRCALAIPVLGMVLALAPKSVTESDGTRAVSARDMKRLALAGAFFAGDLAVWHISIHYTSIANATLLANLAPIFVTIFGFVFFKDRVTRLFMVGMTVALVGAVVLMSKSLTLSAQSFHGDLLGALTAVFYASYILAIGRLRARLGWVVVMFWSTVFTALVLAPIAWASGETFMPNTLDGWVVLLALAVTAQAFGQGMIAYALAHLPVSFSSVSLLFQPVVAALAAWVLFAEALGPLQGLGALVVLVGVAIARQASIKKPA